MGYDFRRRSHFVFSFSIVCVAHPGPVSDQRFGADTPREDNVNKKNVSEQKIIIKNEMY